MAEEPRSPVCEAETADGNCDSPDDRFRQTINSSNYQSEIFSPKSEI